MVRFSNWPLVVDVVVDVFASKRSLYPTTRRALQPVSVLILHPKEVRITWSFCPQTHGRVWLVLLALSLHIIAHHSSRVLTRGLIREGYHILFM